MERMEHMTNPNLFYYTFHKAWKKTDTKTKFEKLDKWKKLKNVTPELENTITHTYGAIEADCEEIKESPKQLELNFGGDGNE